MRQLFIASVLAAVPLLAYADAADDAIEAREGYMKMLAINMGTLAGTAKGEIAFDQAAVTAAASNIEALSKYSTLPALFVPYPAAVDDHQTANARGLVDAQAAILIPESQLDPGVLSTQIARPANRPIKMPKFNPVRVSPKAYMTPSTRQSVPCPRTNPAVAALMSVEIARTVST